MKNVMVSIFKAWVMGLGLWLCPGTVVSGPISPLPTCSLVAQVEPANIYRYEWVDLTVEVTGEIPVTELTLSAVVTHKGNVVEGLGKRTRLALSPQKNRKKWRMRWYVPFAPSLGAYQMTVTAVSGGREVATGSALFEVKGREAARIPKGFAVLTVEGRPELYQTYPSPFDPKKRSLDSLVEWAQWLGADALWCLVGETHAWKKSAYSEPWNSVSLKHMEALAQKAKDEGLKYGGWIATYYIWGDRRASTGYTFATKYDLKEGFKASHFLTLGEPTRHRHLVELAKKLGNYSGLSSVNKSVAPGLTVPSSCFSVAASRWSRGRNSVGSTTQWVPSPTQTVTFLMPNFAMVPVTSWP